MGIIRALGVLAGTALLLSGWGDATARPRGSPQVTVVATSADGLRRLTTLAPLPLRPVGRPGLSDVVVQTGRPQQIIVGYGAAMTDASAELISGKLLPGPRKALLEELFGPSGLGLSFVRMPIGASDFSREHYSLDEMPAGESDPALANFSMARPMAAQVPLLKAARVINPRLAIMASPWSAPGWMKTTGSLIKGSLKPEYEASLATYFVRFLDAMEAAGTPVRFVSMQNEPAFEPADYPGMRVGAAQRARFYAGHLGPALAKRRHKVEILDWDHNWDMPQEPLAVLANPDAARYVGGVAWHCYAGDPKAMGEVRAAHPGKPLYLTECSGGGWAPNWGETLGWMADNLLIRPSNEGSGGTILWNLALDQNAGPHKGGCGNCRGVVTIDSRAGTVSRNVEYYLLGQISRFVRSGARAVPSEGGSSAVGRAAFVNPDGTRVLLVHNRAKLAQPLDVSDGRRRFSATIPAGEVMTFTWAAPDKAR